MSLDQQDAPDASNAQANSPTDGAEVRKIPIFGVRKFATGLLEELGRSEKEIARLEQSLEESNDRLRELGAFTQDELEVRRESIRQEILVLEEKQKDQEATMSAEKYRLSGKITALRQELVATEEESMLQDVGLYEYRHPLDDAVAYKTELELLKDKRRAMNLKDGGAVLAPTDWTVNGSAAEGRRMVRQTSKLLLRAYNAEADNLVRAMKPYKLETSMSRLDKAASSIEKMGKAMNVRISAQYHKLRKKELELTSDFLNKKAEENERQKEERARLREEQKAQLEMERERKRLEKERDHHLNALKRLEDAGDIEAAERLRLELGEIEKAIDDVDYRAANVRAGYVYVISNLGSFGERVVKIGLTRRLDPMDRVRELGDASVPFRFDVHAIFFSEDAVGVERELHDRLADQKMNRVNKRREFFYATPAEVKEHLLQVAGDILEYREEPEAIEFRQSQSVAESRTVATA